MLDIGLEIKILRERLRISAKDLAAQVGLSQSQMSRLEKGQRRIDTKILHRIAEALGVEPAFFFRTQEASATVEAPARESGTVAPSIRFEHLGKLVRLERRKKHLTVDELATKVGKTRAFVAALEDGRHQLDAPLAEKICRALRLSPSYFIEAQSETIEALGRQVTRLNQAVAEAHRGESDASSSIPLYGPLDADLTVEFDDGDVPVGETDDFLRVPGVPSSRAFGVTLADDSMESSQSPSFREGDVVVFGPGVPRSRDLVFVKLDDGALRFRQVFFEVDGRVRLQPLNLNYPAESFTRKRVGAMWLLVVQVARV